MIWNGPMSMATMTPVYFITLDCTLLINDSLRGCLCVLENKSETFFCGIFGEIIVAFIFPSVQENKFWVYFSECSGK